MGVWHTGCFKGCGNITSPELGHRSMGVYYSRLKCYSFLCILQFLKF